MFNGENLEIMFLPLTIRELYEQKEKIISILDKFKCIRFIYDQNKAYLSALERVIYKRTQKSNSSNEKIGLGKSDQGIETLRSCE